MSALIFAERPSTHLFVHQLLVSCARLAYCDLFLYSSLRCVSLLLFSPLRATTGVHSSFRHIFGAFFALCLLLAWDFVRYDLTYLPYFLILFSSSFHRLGTFLFSLSFFVHSLGAVRPCLGFGLAYGPAYFSFFVFFLIHRPRAPCHVPIPVTHTVSFLIHTER